ncbi:MAG: aldehyde ferredoxin oxidoreductase family protein [Thermodesulfobacteriota bacterium]
MGISGQIIDIDLSSETIRYKPFTTSMVLDHLGGFGFNVTTLFREVGPGTDPLGPENLLVLSPGLLTGTAAPCSSRLHICARSPQSGLMGSSSVGGFFGARMHALNIRGIILRGQAVNPIWLHLTAEGPRLLPADHLWGMDTRETMHKLQDELNDKKAETLVIGPAGENRLPFACIMAGIDHAAGRNGLGAVMGAKGLKAITIETIKVSEPVSTETRALVKRYIQSIQKTIPSRYRDWSQLGSAGDIVELNEMGLMGTRNYQQMQTENADRIDGRHLQRYVKKHISCHKCPVHCKAEIQIDKGRHQGFSGGRPEYETAINMGSLCGLTDPDELLYLSNLCNMLGMDTISTGSIIAFAMNLFEKSIITTRETDGLALEWGNARAMETLMHRMVQKEGFGGVLAKGVKQAAEIIGKGAEQYAFHVKGVEIYGCDPRGLSGTALSYAVSLRGGDFTSVYPIPEFRYSPERAEKEFGSRKAVEFTATEGKGAMVRFCMIVSAVVDSIGLCKVAALSIANHFDLEMEAELVRSIAGIEMSIQDLTRIGERIVTMEKCFNLRHGATRVMDNLPEKFTNEPISEGPAKGAKLDLEPMIADFYRAMGWNDNGVPTPETLDRLGLSRK